MANDDFTKILIHDGGDNDENDGKINDLTIVCGLLHWLSVWLSHKMQPFPFTTDIWADINVGLTLH